MGAEERVAGAPGVEMGGQGLIPGWREVGLHMS